ncbi:MAG: hypothetical protein WBM83_11715 [Flavobacteriaceae bacterium]
MKKHFYLIVTSFLVSSIAFGQMLIEDLQQLNDLKKVPLEKMYVHHGSSVLFPGEYLVYSVYCINAYSYNLSEVSKIGYVELVSEKGELVFSHKLRLEKGRAQGDFFIPVEIPSGNYKLLGYTQWMKNGGVKQFFQDDIVIINPYQSDQTVFKPKVEDLSATPIESTPVTDAQKSALEGKDIIQLLTDTKTYEKRSKVSLVPKNYKGALGYGSYSIVVRKKEELRNPDHYSAHGFSKQQLAEKFIPQRVNDSIYLPEQLGELFWGNVSNQVTGEGVMGKTVTISIPGTDFQLKYATTDVDGNFYTYFNREYDANMTIVQVLDDEETEYAISIKEQSPLDYSELKFNSYKLSPEMEKAIVARSVHNQIENAYFTFKPDTILSVRDNDPFIGGNPEVYLLDDYTRFPTLEETLVEVVDNVWVRNVDGKQTLWVREYVEPTKKDVFINLPPLVFVDGIFIPDHTAIVDLNAYTIKTIKTVRDQFVLGGKEYLGMVSIETSKGDYIDLWQQKANSLKKELFKPLPKKNYFNQNYALDNGLNKARIPDFRSQLFWMPELNIDMNEKNFEFYTSDVPGEYEIVLEGFTTYGKPISVRETITVE